MPGGKGTRRQTTRPLVLGLLAVLAGVAAPRDSSGVSVGLGQSVHFTIGETRGGVPGSEGKRRAINTPAPQQGKAGTTLRRVGCAARVAAEDRAVARPRRHKTTNKQGLSTTRAAHSIWREGERAFVGPITRLKFVFCVLPNSTALSSERSVPLTHSHKITQA